MSIRVVCPSCKQTVQAPDNAGGRSGKCPFCQQSIQIPMPGAAAAPAAPPPAPAPAAPAASAPAGIQRMQCQSCGGTVDYQAGQGTFQCRFCGSKYNSTQDGSGQFTVEIVELVKQVIRAGDEMEVSRLQEKAGNIQDKIDFKYVEFFHSWGRKAGSAAIIVAVVGIVVFLMGVGGKKASAGAILAGLGLVGVGVALFFLVFKKAEAAYVAESEQITASELNPVYDQLRATGAGLAGGNVALGYAESTRTPLRYCVSCHQNVTPQKGKGAGGGLFSGVNLMLTIITCGMWLPAWVFIAVVSKASGAARRAVAKGCCPMCATTPMFPARIKNV